jgi:hypothetical protein
MIFGAAFVSAAMAAPVYAQATRTWVSGVGDDANPCSRTAPCKTFAGAISKTAAGGEIDALDPGGFGALTITKAITIDGGGGQVASTLVSGTNGIVVSAGANDVVTLRNLRINGLYSGLNGVQFQSPGGALYLENVTIFAFTQNGVAIEPSANAQVFMKNVVTQESAASGVLVSPSAGTTAVMLDNTALDHNGTGLTADIHSAVTLRASEVSGNTGTGVAASGAGTSVTIEGTVISSNAVGVSVAQNAAVYLSNDDLVNNTSGVVGTAGGPYSPATAQIVSFGNNRFINSPGAPSSTRASQ